MDPAALLPPELYQLVLLFLAIGDPCPHKTDLKSVSQVCRKWRAWALQSSTAWATSIDGQAMALPWLEEVLRRTGNAPVTIDSVIDVEDGPPKRANWELIFSKSGRIKHLKLILDGDSRGLSWFTDLLHTVLGQPTPFLTTLYLIQYRSSWDGVVVDEQLLSGAVRTTLHGPASSLRELTLSGSILDPLPTYFPNLTSLVYSEIEATAHDWVSLFQRMPRLENLVLNLLQADPNTTLPMNSSIALSNLKEMTLIAPLPIIEVFKRSLIIPPSCIPNLQMCVDNPMLPGGTKEESVVDFIEEGYSTFPWTSLGVLVAQDGFLLTTYKDVTGRCMHDQHTRGFMFGDVVFWEEDEDEEEEEQFLFCKAQFLKNVLLRLSRTDSPLVTRLRTQVVELVVEARLGEYHLHERAAEEVNSGLAAFLSVFSRVETLRLNNASDETITSITIPILQGRPPSGITGDEEVYGSFPILLPSLNKVRLLQGWEEGSPFEATLKSYQVWRRDMGRSLFDIDIRRIG